VILFVGSLTDKVYKSNSQTLDELENNIREEITKILEAEFQRVHQNMFLHYNTNLLVSGEHFQHLM
jgi:hypothetical protein